MRKPRFRESGYLAQGLMVFTVWPRLGNVGKECLMMVGALNLKTKPAQFWARDGGQDNRAETRDRGDTGTGEEQLLEEPNRRGLIRAGQVPRAQANPSSKSAGRKR